MHPISLGNTTINLYGASSGVVDLGAGGTPPRSIVAQADLRTNSGYKVGLSMLKASSDDIGTNFAAAKAGVDFGNQPGGDGLHVVSDNATDIGQIVTVYGTRYGTNIVTCEQMTLNGTTAVNSVHASPYWGYMLGMELSGVCLGTVTLQEASGDQTITTIATTVLSSGVADVPTADQRGYDLPVRVFQSDTGTKTVGVVGADAAGRPVYDAITLTNAAITTDLAINGVVPMHVVKKLLYGDLASAGSRKVTFEVGNLVWPAASATLTNGGTDDTTFTSLHPTRRYLHWCFYNDTTATSGGVSDNVLVKLYG